MQQAEKASKQRARLEITFSGRAPVSVSTEELLLSAQNRHNSSSSSSLTISREVYNQTGTLQMRHGRLRHLLSNSDVDLYLVLLAVSSDRSPSQALKLQSLLHSIPVVRFCNDKCSFSAIYGEYFKNKLSPIRRLKDCEHEKSWNEIIRFVKWDSNNRTKKQCMKALEFMRSFDKMSLYQIMRCRENFLSQFCRGVETKDGKISWYDLKLCSNSRRAVSKNLSRPHYANKC